MIGDFLKMLVLGPEYSWSDINARAHREENVLSYEIVYCNSGDKTEGVIEELARQYKNGNYSVQATVPIYNTLEGRVKETLGHGRGLLKYHELKICGERWLDLNYCLASKSEIDKIGEVLSHPQALGQCDKYLKEKGLRTRGVDSTSEAARFAGVISGVAAVCAKETAKAYGLNVLTENIGNNHNDGSENATRFIILSHKDCDNPTGKDKTTFTLELHGEDKPRALYRALDKITQNISHIESMPRGSKKEYVFWIDVDEHRKNLENEIKELSKLTKWMYIHGSYPRVL